MVVLLNKTPHTIHLYPPTPQDGEQPIASFTPHGEPVRCSVESVPQTNIIIENAHPDPFVEVMLYTSTFDPVLNEPPIQEGTMYIVSRIVAEALPHRRDLLIPEQTVRDSQGRIIGCRAFARL